MERVASTRDTNSHDIVGNKFISTGWFCLDDNVQMNLDPDNLMQQIISLDLNVAESVTGVPPRAAAALL